MTATYRQIVESYQNAYIANGLDAIYTMLTVGAGSVYYKDSSGNALDFSSRQRGFLNDSTNKNFLASALTQLNVGYEDADEAFKRWKYGVAGTAAVCRPKYLQPGAIAMFEPNVANRSVNGTIYSTIVPLHTPAALVIIANLMTPSEIGVVKSKLDAFIQSSQSQQDKDDALEAKTVI